MVNDPNYRRVCAYLMLAFKNEFPELFAVGETLKKILLPESGESPSALATTTDIPAN